MSEDNAPDETSGIPEIERLKLKIGLVKFFIGTVALGLVSLFLNHQYQQSQIELEREKSRHAMLLQDKEAEFEYLGRFMKQAMHEDLNVRIQLADYMKSAALSKNIKDIWSRYHEILVEKRDGKNEQRLELEAATAAKSEELKALRGNEADEAKQIAGEIQDLLQQLYYVQDELDRKRFGAFEENFVDFDSLLDQAQRSKEAGLYEAQRDLLLKAYEAAPPSVHYYILSELAFAYRSLRDFSQGLIYMERAAALAPNNPDALLGLAIMQKNAGQIDKALLSLRRAEAATEGSDKLYVQLVIAGYLIHDGQRDAGMAAFAPLEDRLQADSGLASYLAWFYAVAGKKEAFYKALEQALRTDKTGTLIWIDQEVDLKPYRAEQRFKDLLAKYARS